MPENKPVSLVLTPAFIILTIVVLLAIGAGIYFYTQDKTPAPATEPREPAPPAPETEPAANIILRPLEQVREMMGSEPEKSAFVLPQLDASDQLIRDGAVSLTRHEGINAWLSPDELIRKAVVFVDSMANGQVARHAATVLAPKKPFTATRVGKKAYLLDASAYARYNQVTNILLSLDTKRTAEFYLLLKPLFKMAYAELGYPDGDFDAVLLGTIDRLLTAPILPQPLRLTRPVVMYQFADPDIEGLDAVQKQLIRMGPENTAAIQTKLKAFVAALRDME